MKRFKFSSAAYCADWFAAQMCAAHTSQLEEWQPNLITYMPIGLLHYRKRGYNQAELLAKLIAKPLSLPCEATLRKRWFVGKQSAQKDYAARQSLFCYFLGVTVAAFTFSRQQLHRGNNKKDRISGLFCYWKNSLLYTLP